MKYFIKKISMILIATFLGTGCAHHLDQAASKDVKRVIASDGVQHFKSTSTMSRAACSTLYIMRQGDSLEQELKKFRNEAAQHAINELLAAGWESCNLVSSEMFGACTAEVLVRCEQ